VKTPKLLERLGNVSVGGRRTLRKFSGRVYPECMRPGTENIAEFFEAVMKGESV
jgi:hypothetical protein